MTLQYEVPTDSASVSYGANMGVSHYGLCGKRTHYLTLDNKRARINDDQTTAWQIAPYLEFEYFPGGDPGTVDDTARYSFLATGMNCV